MAEKNSFVMRDEDGDVFDMMTDAQAGALIKAIYAYRKERKEPEDGTDVAVRIAFSMIRKKLDHDEEVWLAKQKAGINSGKQRANRTEQKPTEGEQSLTEHEQRATNAGVTVTVTATDTVTDTVTVTEKQTKERKQAKKNHLTVDEEKQMITDRCLPAAVAVVLDDWCEYKEQRKERYQEMGFRKLLTQIEGYVRDYGEIPTIQTINQSMASGYKGIFPPKQQRASPKTEDRLAFIDQMTEEFADNPFV